MKKLPPLKAIRKDCLHCMGNNSEDVKNCTADKPDLTGYVCKVHPYRFGKDPYRKKKVLSPAQLETLRKGRILSKEKSQGEQSRP